MKFFNSPKISVFIQILLVVIISLPTISSLFTPGLFKMHDDMQVMRVYEIAKCIKDFQIPCRWVPDMGYGYGYPQFNYYGPLPYYLMAGIHMLGVSIIDSVKIGLGLSLLLGNIFMYMAAASFFGSFGGLISAAVYAYAPYRAADTFTRGAMGECWGFVFMPLIIYFLKKTIDKPQLKYSALLALSVGGLITSHNISTLIFIPQLLVVAAVLLIQKNGTNIKKLFFSSVQPALGFLLGICVSAFFFLPVVFEKQFAHVETMIGGYFDYRAHFVSIGQMFLSTFWSNGSSELGPHDEFSFFFGPVMLLLIGLSAFFAVKNFIAKRNRKLSVAIITILFLGLFSSFMNHEKSSFIWTFVKPLVYLQFPWRFLSPANLFFAFITGYSFTNLGYKKAISVTIPVIALIFFFNQAFFIPKTWNNITDREKLYGYSWDNQMTVSIYDYLPIFAVRPPSQFAPILPELYNKDISILNYKKASNWLSFSAIATKNQLITLPVYDFPGWKVKVDGLNTKLAHDNELGLISFPITEGTHIVSAVLVESPIRILGDLISYISVALCVIFILRKNDKKI